MNKEKLSYEQIKIDLLTEVRKNFVMASFMTVVLFLFLASLFFVEVLRKFLLSGENIIHILIIAALALGCIWGIYYNFSLFLIIKKQKFRVVTVRLMASRVSTTLPPSMAWLLLNGTTNYILSFSSYGDYVTRNSLYYRWSKLHCMDQKSLYNYSILGDEFYVVVIKGKIYAIYNTKLFALENKE